METAASNMYWVDIAIALIIGISVTISLFRGFMREALSLLAWGLAFYMAIAFPDVMSAWLSSYITNKTVRLITSYSFLFIGTLVLMSCINIAIFRLVEISGLGLIDRIIGVLFGLARGILVVAALILVIRLTTLTQDPAWQHSIFVPYFQGIESWLQGLLSQKMPGIFPPM